MQVESSPVSGVSMSSPTVIRIALAGFGTVGRGVFDLILRHNSRFEKKLGVHFQIAKILVKNLEKHRLQTKGEIAPELFTNDLEDFLEADAEVVVELIGGVIEARALTWAALEKANVKGLVTANKALIFENLAELGTKLEGKFFGMEAAVCGGRNSTRE